MNDLGVIVGFLGHTLSSGVMLTAGLVVAVGVILGFPKRRGNVIWLSPVLYVIAGLLNDAAGVRFAAVAVALAEVVVLWRLRARHQARSAV